MTEYRTLAFTIAVLYSLDEKWRGMGNSQTFEGILRGRNGANLHMAWLALRKEGLLEEFSDKFYFDDENGTSNLHDILRLAHLRHTLIRLDGTNFAYHLDKVSPEVIAYRLRVDRISKEKVRKAAKRLNQLLEEQAAKAKSPTVA